MFSVKVIIFTISCVIIAYCLGRHGAVHSDEALLRSYSQPPPWVVWNTFIPAVKSIETFFIKNKPPPFQMLDHLMAFGKVQVIHVLARLDVAEVLAIKGPSLTPSELCAHITCDYDSLERMLHAAVSIGVFEYDPTSTDGVKFRNNAVSAILRQSHPNTLRCLVLRMGMEAFTVWNHMYDAVKDSTVSAFQRAHPQYKSLPANESIWKFFADHPDKEANFACAMSNVDVFGMSSVVEDYPWASYKRAIDIGGSKGTTLFAIMTAVPHLEGVLFDREPVIKLAKEAWESDRRELMNRISFVAGSFFDVSTIPRGMDGDVYILRVVLHDWNDDAVLTILKGIRTAIGTSNATLAIIEQSFHDDVDSDWIKRFLDLQMLTFNGRERTPKMWKSLFEASGFTYVRSVLTRSPFIVTEAAAK